MSNFPKEVFVSEDESESNANLIALLKILEENAKEKYAEYSKHFSLIYHYFISQRILQKFDPFPGLFIFLIRLLENFTSSAKIELFYTEVLQCKNQLDLISMCELFFFSSKPPPPKAS